MKAKRFIINREEIEELKQIYLVKELSPYHIRVTRHEPDTIIDIFPTSHKFCIKRSSDGYFQKARLYDDLIPFVESILN